jgi:SET domain-containing protein
VTTRTKKPARAARAKSTSARGPLFELRKSAIQGRGAFALRRIRKGTRIIEYVGEIIPNEEADRRYDDDSMKRHHTFLFSLDNGTCIDAAVGGNDSRFINHSCDPNCEATDVKGRIFIEAIRTIQPGEELAYDYAYERDGEHDDEWEQLYVCRCGAANCRGTILAPKPAKTPRSRAAAKKRSSRKTHGTGGKRHAAERR